MKEYYKQLYAQEFDKLHKNETTVWKIESLAIPHWMLLISSERHRLPKLAAENLNSSKPRK